MSDRPLLVGDDVDRRLLPHVDVESKLPQALDAIAHVRGADLAIVRPRPGALLRGLAGLGARIVAVVDPEEAGNEGAVAPAEETEAADAGDGVIAGGLVPRADGARIQVVTGTPVSLGLADRSVDAVVGGWGVYRGVDEAELAEADRVLRPDGRLLVLHDYGRDDLGALAGVDRPEVASWSRVGGPFLRAGFKIRVVHCWLTFESIEQAADILGAAYGAAGLELARSLRRPRLSYNVAIYHRVRPEG